MTGVMARPTQPLSWTFPGRANKEAALRNCEAMYYHLHRLGYFIINRGLRGEHNIFELHLGRLRIRIF